MKKSYRYDLMGATFVGVNMHPQKDMERLGFHIINWHGVTIADCILVQVDNAEGIKELPEYITAELRRWTMQLVPPLLGVIWLLASFL